MADDVRVIHIVKQPRRIYSVLVLWAWLALMVAAWWACYRFVNGALLLQVLLFGIGFLILVSAAKRVVGETVDMTEEQALAYLLEREKKKKAGVTH